MEQHNHFESARRFLGGLKHLPEVDVNEDVFLTLLMADGESFEEAEATAYHCKTHDTRILIRNRLVGIKKEDYSAEG